MKKWQLSDRIGDHAGTGVWTKEKKKERRKALKGLCQWLIFVSWKMTILPQEQEITWGDVLKRKTKDNDTDESAGRETELSGTGTEADKERKYFICRPFAVESLLCV